MFCIRFLLGVLGGEVAGVVEVEEAAGAVEEEEEEELERVIDCPHVYL